MAEILTGFGKELESDKLKEVEDRYRIPVNCPYMGVPLTNREIRKCLDPATKTLDTRMYNTQGVIANMATAVTHCSDLITKVNKKLRCKTKEEVRENRAKLADVAEKLADALLLLGHTNHSLSQKRRDMHKLCLPHDSAGICEPNVEMTPEWLYPPGAEFHKAIKEAKASKRLEKEKRSGPSQEVATPHLVNEETFSASIPALQAYLKCKHESFVAGQARDHLDTWAELTTDKYILQTVSGMKIDFESDPSETQQRNQRSFSPSENQAADKEIAKLLKQKVIKYSDEELGQIVSPIFVRPKKNGTYRMILNLKGLNQSIAYRKFKMETLQAALNLVSQNCYFASVDLRDAYYTVPLAEE